MPILVNDVPRTLCSISACESEAYTVERRAGKAGEAAEVHLNDPMAIAQLQAAARDNSAAAYREYAAITHRLNQQINLRGMFRFKRAAQPLSLDEVRSLHRISTPE